MITSIVTRLVECSDTRCMSLSNGYAARTIEEKLPRIDASYGGMFANYTPVSPIR